jgi:hypothetical protein
LLTSFESRNTFLSEAFQDHDELSRKSHDVLFQKAVRTKLNTELSAGLTVALLMVAAAAVSAGEASSSKTKITFNDKGLSSIQVEGKERFVLGAPLIWRIKTLSGAALSATPLSSTFEQESRKCTLTYPWGSAASTYATLPEGLRIRTVISNTSGETITELGFNMVSLAGLGEGQKLGRGTSGVEGPPLIQATGAEGSLVYVLEANDKPLMLDLNAGTDGRTKAAVLNCRVNLGGERVIVDNVTTARPIPPGTQDKFAVEVRLGGPGSAPLSLAQEFIAQYRSANPALLNWRDRRPILRLFFNGGLPVEQAVANLRDPDSARLPPPDPQYQAFVLARMKTCVEAAKAANSQGVLLWDLEGNTFPHATTYIGDPRLIRLLNPQMEMVIDKGIKILKDAGLRVGVTVRPSRVLYSKEKDTAVHSHTDAKDPFLELDGKVAYAKKRWGCTLFYVDTNCFWRRYGAEQKWQPGTIAPDVWQRLLAKYPDTLFIPEIADYADYRAAASYGQADMGDYGTPELVRAIWPNSFRLIAIENADPFMNFDRFVACVRSKNVLMTYPVTMNTPHFQGLLRINQETAMLETGVPAAVQKSKPEELARLLTAANAAVRFHAARRLIETPVASAATPLLARVRDQKEEWVVRRSSILALEKVPAANTIPVLLDLLADHELGLYAAAITALAGQGDAAIEPVLQRLEAEAVSENADPVTLETVGSALVAMDAREQAARLEELVKKVPDGKNAIAARRSLLSVIGRLHNPTSELFLLTELADANLQQAAATGLARLGSQTGIARIKAMLEEAKKNGNGNLAEKLASALKQK